MSTVTVWLNFCTAALGLLAALVVSVRAIVRWGAARGILPLLLSTTLDAIAIAAWIIAAIFRFEDHNVSVTLLLIATFVMFTILGFGTNPSQSITRREIGLLVFQIANAAFMTSLVLIGEIHKVEKRAVDASSAVTAEAPKPKISD